MERTLRDFILDGGISGKSFVCIDEIPRYCGSFLNKPYKIISLSCYKETFNIKVKFYNHEYDSLVCLALESSLNDPEATKKEIDAAKKEREYKLKKLVSSG